MTTHSKSTLPMRSAMPARASSISTPSRVSTSARRNSLAIGSRALADDGVDRLRQRETGREAAGHQLQGVGELVR